MAKNRKRIGPGVGQVWLVGAGPGDPELMTLKAVRLLESADVVVYDRLVGVDIRAFGREDAKWIAVGKTPGRPSPRQQDINEILIREARAGHDVVRLKGGDPYIFGRGGEEQAALEAAGVDVEVVPGITAATACAASVGLPLTTRARVRSFTILTATSECGPATHDWDRLARPGEAFAIYMGVRVAPFFQQQLLASGIDPATPVTVVENGTLRDERRLDTEISRLTADLEAEAITGPAVIFVGFARAQSAVVTDDRPVLEPEVIPFAFAEYAPQLAQDYADEFPARQAGSMQ